VGGLSFPYQYTESNIADGRHLEDLDGVISQTQIDGLDEILYADTERYADEDDVEESEPEVEIQFGRRLFSESGSGYISAVNLPIRLHQTLADT